MDDLCHLFLVTGDNETIRYILIPFSLVLLFSGSRLSKFTLFEILFCSDFVKSIIQGFLPGIALKIFLIVLPYILMAMSQIEGFRSLSSLERRSAHKYYMFILVNVFLGSIIAGTAFQQLDVFLNRSPAEYVA